MRTPLSPAVLEALLTVAECGSIRRAADRLFISPSSVNRQILRLEQRIGTPLFKRESRGMRPTRACEILLAAAREIDRAVTDALDQVRALRDFGRGRVSFGTITTFAETRAGPLIAGLRRAYPDLAVSYFAGNSSEVVERVLEGRLDFGFCWDAPSSSPVERLASVTVPVGIAMRPDHPLARHPGLHLEDCLPHPIVFPARGLEVRQVLDRINLGIGRTVPPAVEASSMAALRGIALAGQDLVAISANAVLDAIESGLLLFKPLRNAGCETLTLSLFRREGAPAAGGGELLLAALSGEADALRARLASFLAG